MADIAGLLGVYFVHVEHDVLGVGVPGADVLSVRVAFVLEMLVVVRGAFVLEMLVVVRVAFV